MANRFDSANPSATLRATLFIIFIWGLRVDRFRLLRFLLPAVRLRFTGIDNYTVPLFVNSRGDGVDRVLTEPWHLLFLCYLNNKGRVSVTNACGERVGDLPWRVCVTFGASVAKQKNASNIISRFL